MCSLVEASFGISAEWAPLQMHWGKTNKVVGYCVLPFTVSWQDLKTCLALLSEALSVAVRRLVFNTSSTARLQQSAFLNLQSCCT